jgi:uncharacterized protein YndB with AHSA1/START domain
MTGIEKSASIMIRRPLIEVFNFVADPEKFTLWQPFVTEAVLTSPKPIHKGTTYRYSFKALGNVLETSGVITEYEPFHRYQYQSTSSPFPIKGGFSFQEVDDFVEVTAFGEAESGGYFSMAQSLIGLMLGRQLKVMLQTLKELLESKG